MKLSGYVTALISVFEKEAHLPSQKQSSLSISPTVTTLAVLYEKARNAVEFRADHLVRRAAIERILRRQTLLTKNSRKIAENLSVELAWAKYIDASLIGEEKMAKISHIIAKYLEIKNKYFANILNFQNLKWETIVGLASSEIDEAIISSEKREAFSDFVYQALREKIKIPEIDEERLNILTYISIKKYFSLEDNALISYYLLRLIYPSWFNEGKDSLNGQKEELLFKNLSLIDSCLKDPALSILSKYLKRHLPSFRLLRDIFYAEDGNVGKLIADPKSFQKKLYEVAEAKYAEIDSKITRAIGRSVIYIFLTKMVFAFAMEVPYDLLIIKKINYLPIGVNLIFPPLLLYLIAKLITPPDIENTNLLNKNIQEIVYNFDSFKKEVDFQGVEFNKRRPRLAFVFTLLYSLGFLLSFGFIFFILSKLHFNIVSQTVFIFFVALVTIFAYRIRKSAQEYQVKEKASFIEPIIDFFFLPILRAGDFLSREIAKINFLAFIFDLILEAPLKLIFEFIEEWIRFIRVKKEEIV
jgi:hypothetical protein